jgi:hypothetical protein
MVKTPYVLAQVTMTGITPFYCLGGNIDDETKTTDEYHGGSSDRLSETQGQRTVKWSLDGPLDHMSLNLLAYQCRAGFTFTITWFGQDANGVFRALERTDGCSSLNRKRTFGSFKNVGLTIAGSADNTEPLLATYT